MKKTIYYDVLCFFCPAEKTNTKEYCGKWRTWYADFSTPDARENI